MQFDVIAFHKTYRGTKWFSETSRYYTEFLQDIQNKELMSHLRLSERFVYYPIGEKRKTCSRCVLRFFISIWRICCTLRAEQRTQHLGK